MLTRAFLIDQVLIFFVIQAGGPISKIHLVFDEAFLYHEIMEPFDLFSPSILDLSLSLLRFKLEAKEFSCMFTIVYVNPDTFYMTKGTSASVINSHSRVELSFPYNV